jgi:hypothetical protein
VPAGACARAGWPFQKSHRSKGSGEFLSGQAFPSVRAVGTVVARLPQPRSGDKKKLLREEVQRLLVEAKRMGLQLDEVITAVEREWASLEKPLEVNRKC